MTKLGYDIPPEILADVKSCELDLQNGKVWVHYECKEDYYEHGFFTGTNGKKEVKVLFSEVLYVRRVKKYTIVYTLRGKYLLDQKIKEVLKELKEPHFLRIHQSIIVNVHFLFKPTYKKLYLQVGNKEEKLPIGKTFQHQCCVRFGVHRIEEKTE